MREVTTKHLLKILPLEEEVRKEALANFDRLSEDQKFRIRMLCWQVFYQLVDEKARFEFYRTLLQVKEGKGGLQKNLYQKSEERAFEEMREKLVKEAGGEVVEEAKEELGKVVAAAS
jgi:hypothetical protein